MTNGELIKILAKLGIHKYDKSREPERKRQAPPSMEVSAADERTVRQRAKNTCQYPGCSPR